MNAPAIRLLRDVDRSDRAGVGGKAAGLGELIKIGVRVPDGFVVTAQTLASAGRAGFADDYFRAEVLRAFDGLHAPLVAVRSSAIAEDAAEASWAGQLETFLCVGRDDLMKRIKDCWASAASPRARAYAAAHGSSGGVAVVVQAMIASEVSGVAFSVNPVNGKRSEMVVEAGFGLGEAVVSGQITPDTYVVGKSSLEVLGKDIAVQSKRLDILGKKLAWQDIADGNGQKLDDQRIVELAAAVRSIEAGAGFAVDVEWAAKDSALYFLQSRPITTLQVL